MELKDQEIINSNVAVATLETQEKQYQIIEIKGGKFYLFLKRTMDICASFLGIVILALPLLIIGLLVKLTSKGPMIYVSKRVGKDGKIFNFYKFRSMRENAEAELKDLLSQNEVEGGVTFKMKDDPRITKFGKFLRKTSLDELPQLFNILKGDMSIVGPRPCTDREYALYTEREKIRLRVPQGLTGEWQVRGRSNTTFDEMIEMDIEYVTKKRGFWYDIGLIFRTIPAFLFRKGAE